MRIAPTGSPEIAPVGRAAEAAPADAAPALAGAAAPLQSAAIAPALAALEAMPDIDMAKVEQLRDALARGAVPFDAGKLAGLITRFHAGRS